MPRSAITAIWTFGRQLPPEQLQTFESSTQGASGYGRAFLWSSRELLLAGAVSGLLPEDAFDRQPLWAADRSFCLIADVRLDNRADLARQLGLTQPETLADSAFLSAAWDRWGAACLDHIVGAFSFAVWTPARNELFAARDHTGDRPLYYHHTRHLFALASQPHDLLRLPDLRPPGASQRFNTSQLVDSLAALPPNQASSFFESIQRLPAGHLLRVTPESLHVSEYWHPTHATAIRFTRDADYAEALRDLVERAIHARLRTTGQVGCHLSAGLDSSSVAASAAALLAQQGRTLTAFTAVPRPAWNHVTEPWLIPSEGELAALTARMYPNILHVLLDSSGGDLLGTMRRWTPVLDGPVPNPVNMLWVDRILGHAHDRGITVLLEGPLGNASISWEPASIYAHLFRRGRWVQLFNTARSLRRHGDISASSALRLSLAGLLPQSLERVLTRHTAQSVHFAPLIHAGFADSTALQQRLQQTMLRPHTRPSDEHAAIYALSDFAASHLASQSLHGVDVRDPTADKRILEFCFAIPPEQYIVGGHSRSLLRRAMQGRLPDEVRLQYKRGFQAADWYLTIGEALPSIRHEIDLLEQSPTARQTLDLPAMRSLIDTWPQAGFHKREVWELWNLALMRALSVGCFLRAFESAPV